MFTNIDINDNDTTVKKSLIINCPYNGTTIINNNIILSLSIIVNNDIVVINYESIPLPFSGAGFYTEYIKCKNNDIAKKLRNKIIELYVEYKNFEYNIKNKTIFWNVKKIIEKYNEFKNNCYLIEDLRDVRKLFRKNNDRKYGRYKKYKKNKKNKRNQKVFNNKQKSNNSQQTM